MFKRINIASFGSFHDYAWRDVNAVGPTETFQQVNIIYGRNYSGKTTLSRIFRSFEQKALPPRFEHSAFVAETDAGPLSQSNLSLPNCEVRVYNRDFAVENLSFLTDGNSGEIKPFAIVGSKNKDIELKIDELEKQLGDAATGQGTRASSEAAKLVAASAQKAAVDAKAEIENKLRKHANEVIKPDRDIGSPNYIIDSIKKDILRIASAGIAKIPYEQESQFRELLKESVVPSIQEVVSFDPKLFELRDRVAAVVTREIKPSIAIQELLNEELLQEWVKRGISLHRNKRTACGFCRQPLPENIWTELDAHFDKESMSLELRLNDLMADVRRASEVIAIPESLKAGLFYSTQAAKFESILALLDEELETYRQQLGVLLEALEGRKRNLFSVVPAPVVIDNAATISNLVEQVRLVIAENNARSASLEQEKYNARESLRLDSVVEFLAAIDYPSLLEKVGRLEVEAQSAQKAILPFLEEEKQIIKSIRQLQSQLNDERAAAEVVNGYLNSHFGHQGLRLEANTTEGVAGVKFTVKRGADLAYNLSEGECSLIAFCYFIAKLQDVDTAGKDMIIYIDDPISSLDSNHVFFIFSLIESVITAPIIIPNQPANQPHTYKYKQFFVSTHSLDFFKYLKRLSAPNNKTAKSAYFLIERGGSASNIRSMPPYLQKYQTEFIYLFHQIYKCRVGPTNEQEHETFYSFGNNLRKFLEAYLFYKYPYEGDNQVTRLRRFFGEDSGAVAVATRIGNELSHLEEIFDRSMRPIEIPEIPSLATYVLDAIWSKDRDQYNSLLRSIGEPERVP